MDEETLRKAEADGSQVSSDDCYHIPQMQGQIRVSPGMQNKLGRNS